MLVQPLRWRLASDQLVSTIPGAIHFALEGSNVWEEYAWSTYCNARHPSSPVNTFLGTLATEFSDLSDVAQLTRILVRLLLAAVLGFLLGFEREHRGKPAGVRTHMLVAIGSALFMLVPEQIGIQPQDISRVVQGLIAGIGFLCAGTILKQGQQEEHVTGMTTAAGLWMTAAIGMACGLGHGVMAIASASLTLVVLMLMPPIVIAIERLLRKR